MKTERTNGYTLILFAIYMCLLTGVILFKLPFYSVGLSEGVRIINLIPLGGSFDDEGVLVWREIMENILIFVPFGVYISMLKGKWSFMKKLLPILGLSFVFEMTQFIFAMGRSDMTDLLGNTLGGGIGICCYGLLFRFFGSRAIKVVNLIALAATVYVVLYFGYLFYLSHFVMQQPDVGLVAGGPSPENEKSASYHAFTWYATDHL